MSDGTGWRFHRAGVGGGVTGSGRGRHRGPGDECLMGPGGGVTGGRVGVSQGPGGSVTGGQMGVHRGPGGGVISFF